MTGLPIGGPLLGESPSAGPQGGRATAGLPGKPSEWPPTGCRSQWSTRRTTSGSPTSRRFPYPSRYADHSARARRAVHDVERPSKRRTARAVRGIRPTCSATYRRVHLTSRLRRLRSGHHECGLRSRGHLQRASPQSAPPPSAPVSTPPGPVERGPGRQARRPRPAPRRADDEDLPSPAAVAGHWSPAPPPIRPPMCARVPAGHEPCAGSPA